MQEAAGIGQGTPSHSSQWLQGALAALRSVAGTLGTAAAAATVMIPPASTARQPNKAARARKRFMG